MVDPIKAFLLRQTDKADKTLQSYRDALHLAQREIGDLMQATQEDILEFLSRYTSKASWNLYFSVLRVFYAFHNSDVLKGLKYKKLEPNTDKILDIKPKHVEWYLNACTNLRDRALLSILFECGFRRGEVQAMRVKDVTFDQYGVLLHCPQGKTGARTVRGVTCSANLAAWLESHPRKTDPNAALFCVLKSNSQWGAVRGEPLSKSSFEAIAKRVRKDVKKEHPTAPHFHLHKARHFAATQAAKSMNTQILKKRFGWRSNVMPDVYVHLNNDDANNKYLESMGVVTKEHVSGPPTCPRCHTPNMDGAHFCAKCGSPMTWEQAVKIEEKEKEVSQVLAELLAQNPTIVAQLQALLPKPA